MHVSDWADQANIAVTVCDPAGIILDMNEKSVRTFEKDGGRALIGSNVLDCHPEPSRTMLKGMLAKPLAHTYTIEKAGVRKLIHQMPWFREGEYAGFVELAIELPADMAHFVRQP